MAVGQTDLSEFSYEVEKTAGIHHQKVLGSFRYLCQVEIRTQFQSLANRNQTTLPLASIDLENKEEGPEHRGTEGKEILVVAN